MAVLYTPQETAVMERLDSRYNFDRNFNQKILITFR